MVPFSVVVAQSAHLPSICLRTSSKMPVSPAFLQWSKICVGGGFARPRQKLVGRRRGGGGRARWRRTDFQSRRAPVWKVSATPIATRSWTRSGCGERGSLVSTTHEGRLTARVRSEGKGRGWGTDPKLGVLGRLADDVRAVLVAGEGEQLAADGVVDVGPHARAGALKQLLDEVVAVPLRGGPSAATTGRGGGGASQRRRVARSCARQSGPHAVCERPTTSARIASCTTCSIGWPRSC